MPDSVALAVDIGGTKILSALVGADGRLVPGSRSRRPTGRDLTPADLSSAVRHCLDRSLAAGDGVDVIGVGIGSAGPVDLIGGRILPKNLPQLHGVAIRDEVSAFVPGRPAILRLDGTCISVAEQWIGATRNASSSMSMVVSTGIGGGLVVDGRIVAGISGNARAGAFFDYSRDVAISRTGLGDEGPLIGAGALVHRPILGGAS